MKKPLKISDTYYTDSNFNVMKFSENEINKLARHFIKSKNALSSYKFRHKVKDCGSHWVINYW